MQILRHDGVAHCQRNRAVRSRKRSKPLVAASGSVRQPYIKRDELRSILETAVLDARRERHVPLMCLEGVRAKIQDVL